MIIGAGMMIAKVNYPNTPSTLLNNLRRYYSLNNTTAEPISGSNGTLLSGGSNRPAGSPATQFVSGKISFGLQGNMSFPDFALSSTWTISLWEKNPNQSNLPIYGPSGTYIGQLATYAVFGTSIGIFWEQLTIGGNWRFGYYGGSGPILYSSTQAITSDFKHIVMSYDNGTINFYLDGVANSTYNSVPNLISFNTLGAGYDGFVLHNGILDEVGIWSRVLTPTEILELYNSGNGKAYPFS